MEDNSFLIKAILKFNAAYLILKTYAFEMLNLKLQTRFARTVRF